MKTKIDRIKEIHWYIACNPDDFNPAKCAAEVLEIAQEPECPAYQSVKEFNELVQNALCPRCGADSETYREMMHAPCCEG